MACRTLAHIDFDEKHIRRVIAFGRVKVLLPLLRDPVLSVREAVATALRFVKARYLARMRIAMLFFCCFIGKCACTIQR